MVTHVQGFVHWDVTPSQMVPLLVPVICRQGSVGAEMVGEVKNVMKNARLKTV